MVRNVAWKPGHLGQGHLGPRGKQEVGVGAQCARGSAKSLSFTVTPDQPSTRNEDFRTGSSWRLQ